MCSCHSILECCVTFSGVKLSIRSFVLFQNESIFKISSKAWACDYDQNLKITKTC